MSLIPRIIAPLPVILLFANNIDKVRGFVIAYILAAILSGLKIYFINYDISFSTFLSDPTLRSFGIIFYNSQNYHWFSYPFAISLILIFPLISISKSIFIKLLLFFSACLCIYFILLAGSRQTIYGGGLILIFFSWWIFKVQKRKRTFRLIASFILFLTK